MCVCKWPYRQLAVGGLTLFFLSFFFLFCQGRTGSWLLGLAHADHCGEGMDLPAVFTRVSSSLQWIRATLPELSVYPEQFDMTLEFSALGLPEGECQLVSFASIGHFCLYTRSLLPLYEVIATDLYIVGLFCLCRSLLHL